MTPNLALAPPSPDFSGPFWAHGRCPLALPLVLGLLIAAPASGAEDDRERPSDPLAPTAAPAVNQRGYFGGGSVPSALQQPSRLQLGDFAFGGQASFGALYDDNVEADDTERDEDVFLTFSPSVRAQSTYARHSIGFGAGASTGTALKNRGDDFFDWQVGADGRLDLSRTTEINASLGYRRDVEDDESVDAEDDDGDTPIHRIDAGVGYAADGDRLGFSIDAAVSRRDLEGDDFEDRDSTTYGLSGRLRFHWSDNLTLSMGPSFRHSAFDQDIANDGDGRDADRIDFQIGASYQASRTIAARASLGYAQVNFDDPDRENDDSATGTAGLTWSSGSGTTLDLNASRSLELSIEDGEDARTRTAAAAKLAHSLSLGSRSALTSSIALNITRLSDLDRTDKNVIADLTFGYRLAEHAVLTSSYRYSQRFSDDEDAEFYRNLISLGVTLSY